MGREINEFELNEVEDTLHGSVGSRLALFSKEYGLTKGTALRLPKDCYSSFVIHPNGR